LHKIIHPVKRSFTVGDNKSRFCPLVYFLLDHNRDNPDVEDDERPIRVIHGRGLFLGD
jgi:hypothetical protein